MSYSKIKLKHTRRNIIRVYPEAKGKESIKTTIYRIRIQMRLYNQYGDYKVFSINSSDSFSIYDYSDVFGIRDLLQLGLINHGYHDWSKLYCDWILDTKDKKPTKKDIERKVYLPGKCNPKNYMKKTKNQRRIEVQIQLQSRMLIDDNFTSWKYLQYNNENKKYSSSTFCILGITQTTAVTRILLAILEGQSYKESLVKDKNGKERKIKEADYETGEYGFGRRDGAPFRHVVIAQKRRKKQ